LTTDPTSTATSPSSSLDVATLRVAATGDGVAEFTVPGTQYNLHLAVDAGFEAAVGHRIKGRVHGRALRMHRAGAGGNFIEPLQGRPRIVQGTVLAIDPAANEVILDLVVPVRIAMQTGQSATAFSTGDVVNFYMEPGTRFTALAAD
jgi:hypothetical protein